MESTNKIFDKEALFGELEEVLKNNLLKACEKSLKKIEEDLKKIDQNKIVSNLLKDFDAEKTDKEELFAKLGVQIKSQLGNIVAETLKELPKLKPVQRSSSSSQPRPSVPQNSYAAAAARSAQPIQLPSVSVGSWADEHDDEERQVSAEPTPVPIPVSTPIVVEPIKKFFGKIKDFNKYPSQKDFDNLNRLILKVFLDSFEDYNKLSTYLDIQFQLGNKDPEYERSMIVSKFLSQLSNTFSVLGLNYMDFDYAKLKINDEVWYRLNEYVFDDYMEKAYKNLYRILAVITNHIVRGGSLKFDKNFDVESYPFLKSLFVMN